ncbi:MAG: SpoIVB peptidase S55 domain-containing protein [Intestinibacter sp.]|uniref:SpoIVB peptidase S55 domain-containing protein n=2 Tax=Intestinibacter sp. TaxID=1965304 RepID=UPI002A81480E|nr:SpoIVB peptidase S55 domain-containing protein [Intestinibacter sp.]MDY4575189.1 SpoIVB peptidase S55 domain-containing protein [Intestinibacter sp.]
MNKYRKNTKYKKNMNMLGVIFIRKTYMIVLALVLGFILFNLNKLEALDTFSDSQRYVYVLGDVIGIKANTDGVLVLGGEDQVEYVDKLKKGDNILYINGKKINSSQDVYDILNRLKTEYVDITFEREGQFITKSIKTKKENGIYKLGFWVRDKVSGVGTMTCYDPKENLFYAIGHPICDIDTQKILKINQGDIYSLHDLKISKGAENRIGQIKVDFDLKNKIGSFNKNSDYGIEGVLSKDLSNIDKNRILKVAGFNQIKLGKAEILFQSENNTVKYYDILIKNIDKESKILEIEIIDRELINYTGGIIQGMSGTPIVQNKKLIGSIAYVLKNNPKKGFGIFIGEMIKWGK